jgi:hypothetical protein
MSFEKGSLSFRIFIASELPEDAVERFAANAMPPLKSLAQEELHGWVAGRHLLDRDINEMSAYLAGYLRLTLTKAVKKIPSSLLNAECAMEELAYMEAEGVEFVNQGARREIKENVRERLLPEMPPQLAGIDFVQDLNTNYLYSTATSESQTEAFQLNYLSTVGHGVEPADPFGLAMRVFNKDVRDWAPMSFSPEVEASMCDGSAGREFMMWLWYTAENNLAGVDLEGIAAPVAMNLEGPLMLVNEGSGAHETVIKKGNPMNSSELKTALMAGKMLKRAKVNMAMGDQVWSFTMDADEFKFSGMKLPPTESYDSTSRFAERMVHVDMFRQMFFGLFGLFAAERTKSDEWSQTVKAIRQWVADRPTAKN